MSLFSQKSSSATYQTDQRATSTDQGVAVSRARDVQVETVNDDVFYSTIEFANNALLSGAATVQSGYERLIQSTNETQVGLQNAYQLSSQALQDKLKEAQSGGMTYIVPIILAVVLPIGAFIYFIKGKK